MSESTDNILLAFFAVVISVGSLLYALNDRDAPEHWSICIDGHSYRHHPDNPIDSRLVYEPDTDHECDNP